MKRQVTNLLVLALLAARAVGAATITVTSAADSGPGTLRGVLDSAADGDTINFSVSGAILLTSGELLVNKSVTILGPGPARLSVGGEVGVAGFRVFHIDSNTVPRITGLTITGGGAEDGAGIYNDHATLTVSNCVLMQNWSYGSGGGINNNGRPDGNARLRIEDSAIVANSAYAGGGIFNAGTLTIDNSTLTDNDAGGGNQNGGGGIYNYFGSLMMSNCRLTDNTANSIGGGAIFNLNSFLSVSNCTLAHNWADTGAGIANYAAGLHSSVASIVSSSLSSNIAFSSGGAIYNAGGSNWANLEIAGSMLEGNWANRTGAGIENAGRLRFVNGTLSGNSAGGFASGIHNSGPLTLANTTLVGEPGAVYNNGRSAVGLLEIGSTVLNTGAAGSAIVNDLGTVISLGYNLSSGADRGVLNQPTDQNATDPLLGPLQDNGGPTLTHALLPASPAIDKGKNLSGSVTDQRGFQRTCDDVLVANAPGGDGTDIGAFEVQRGDCTSPAEQIRELVALVQGLNLPAGTANSLAVKLQAAADALARGNTQAACGSLRAFLNELNAQSGKKLAAAQAILLKTEATRIRAGLNCSPSSL